MDYFKVNYPPGERLGMSVSRREESSSTPNLGNTIIDTVDANGISKQNGVEPGDFILSINDQYVAFMENIDVVDMLKAIIGDRKNLTIIFTRMNKFEWGQIVRGESIREGMVAKLHTGLFKKWNNRFLKVTRDTLEYSLDGVLKGKYSVDTEEVGFPRVAVGYPHGQGVFQLKAGDKDMTLQTNSVQLRNEWMHAIDCAKRKTFYMNVGDLSVVGSGRTPPLQQQQQQQTSSYPNGGGSSNGGNFEDASEAYLRMGRAALMKQQQQQQYGASSRSLASQKSSAGEGQGIYKILSLSKVQAASGPDNVIALEGIKDPSSIALEISDYDFSLEQRVLQSSSSQ